ncbi:MAG: bifunctional 4-hydroxy-2-oxoglutarate aldolase/2-dehydro-3-deoxy-phosphogluconate aldolase [Hyphomicrobiaceae bacterium]
MSGFRIVPVIRAASAELSATAADWLAAAGLRIIEFTMTTPDALARVQSHRGRDNMLVACGSILSVAEANAALKSRAWFIFTPCWVHGVVERCREAGVAALTGAVSTSQVWRAHRAGASAVKLFPATSLGGPGFLKQIRAVFPQALFMPIGGAKPESVADCLAACAFCIGLESKVAPSSRLPPATAMV